MLFNSFSFLLFFPIVVMAYFAMPAKWRWAFLLAASYYFYMCWKVEYILLIVISTVVDYWASINMDKSEDEGVRKRWLYLSLFTNLGILFFFKYFNFVGDNINAMFDMVNIFYNVPIFDVLLPVGISFYTFQTLSYTIDVYNRKLKPEKHFGIFALYVSFFPQLVAGPIERPQNLLPQFHKTYDFNYQRVVDGLKLMLWGFFLKLVIADRVAPIVNQVFNNPEDMVGVQVLLGSYFFCFQIFCDFAGYSSIAIGAAKVMGYNLMENFRRPYFAKSIQGFWRRWHISLSTWFRDYVYIPLGGNRVVKWRWYYNLMVTFVVSGVWHGANWTFIVWGFLHGLYIVIENVMKELNKDVASVPQSEKTSNLGRIVLTFLLVWFAWIFFRANNIGDAFTLIGNLFVLDGYQLSDKLIPKVFTYQILLSFGFIFIMELFHYLEEYHPEKRPMYSNNVVVRWATYLFFMMSIALFGVFESNDFIYFQF